MGHNWYRVTLKGESQPRERRFGEVVQIVKGKYSWFLTVHKAMLNHRCDGCSQIIYRGEHYARLHTPRYELDDNPRVDRICDDCIAIGKHGDAFSNVEVFEK